MNNRDDKPSVYTQIYWLIQDKKINSDSFFVFSRFFWPEFIKKEKFVFLKEKFSEDEFNRLTRQGSNIEYWINLITVDDFFPELEDGEQKSMLLAKTLVQIWEAKLKKDFPSMSFTVEYLHDNEYGDYGLTFYQIS